MAARAHFSILLAAMALVACAEPDEGDAGGGALDPPGSDGGEVHQEDGGLLESDAGAVDAGALDAGALDAGALDAGALDAGALDAGLEQSVHDPVLFVHGINGSASDFDAMIAGLIDDGWPADRLFARTFEDPSWGCNIDNAATLSTWIEEIVAVTGSARVDLVAHSMGTLSTRHYVKVLGGTSRVNTYVTLGGQHLGLWSPCASLLNPLGAPCVWSELCASEPFITDLNAEPATPGALHWVSIYSTDDEVVPAARSVLAGAENIELSGMDHMGLLSAPIPYEHVRRVLQYAAW